MTYDYTISSFLTVPVIIAIILIALIPIIIKIWVLIKIGEIAKNSKSIKEELQRLNMNYEMKNGKIYVDKQGQ
jgi:hypothetical protein